MIVPYIPLLIAMVIILVEPHHRCHGHLKSGVAVGWPDHSSSKGTRRCGARTGWHNWNPAAPARAAKQAPPQGNQAPPAKVAALPPPGGVFADINKTTIRQVTAATAVAERLTAATRMARPRNPGNPAPASASRADALVVLVMARPEIKLVSDLAGKSIAIDDRYSASNDNVRLAIAAAGAPEVMLSGGPTKPISRLMGEKAPAAVLALVSPDAAEVFPDIAGFKIFRIPLPSR